MTDIKTVFCILYLSLLAGLPAGVNGLDGVNEHPDLFYFAVTGDRTGHEIPGVFESMLQKVNLLRPAFVVNVGDNIQGYSDDPNVIQQQWKEFDQKISTLQMPYLTVPGNHDVSNEMMAKIYQQRFGKSYYHVIYKNVLFLFLNTDDPSAAMDPAIKQQLYNQKNAIKEKVDRKEYSFKLFMEASQFRQKEFDQSGGTISDEQCRYFLNVLEENPDVRWTFVILHKPVWKKSIPLENWAKIESQLAGRPYTVFAGHEHLHAYSIRNNRDYIVLGTSGGSGLPPGLPGVYQHILWVAMGSGEPSIINLLNDGILKKDEIKGLEPAVNVAKTSP